VSSRWSTKDDALLARLEAEERDLSAERRRLHDRIDNFGADDALVAREHEVSTQRRKLHVRIDRLRARREASRAAPPAGRRKAPRTTG
jgi:hypothetical protein